MNERLTRNYTDPESRKWWEAAEKAGANPPKVIVPASTNDLKAEARPKEKANGIDVDDELSTAQVRIAELEKDIERWLIVGSDAGETIQNLESQLKTAKEEVVLQTGKADYLRNEFKSLKEYADGSVDTINELNTEIERLDRESLRLRTLVWSLHGHTGLYGDDGELQCNQIKPICDFKRDTIERIEEHIQNRGMAELQLNRTLVTERDALKAELSLARTIQRGEASQWEIEKITTLQSALTCADSIIRYFVNSTHRMHDRLAIKDCRHPECIRVERYFADREAGK